MKKTRVSNPEAAGKEWDGEGVYRHLFETMSQGVVYHNLDGVIRMANPAAGRLLGMTQDQLLGKTSMDPRWNMITPDGVNVPGSEHPAMQTLRTGKPVGPVIRGVFRPDKNEYVWLAITSVPLFRAGESEPYQVFATFDDISELRRMQEEYQTLFREMLDGFAVHELIVDEAGKPADYRFLTVNPAFERMTGLRRADILGRTVLEVFPGIERYWIETYGNVALTGEPALFENYSAGVGKHFRVTAFRPSPNRFACIFIDITERKRAEVELEQSNLNLEAKVKARTGDLNEAQRIAHMGSWHLDLATNEVTWTDELYRMFGFDPSQPVPPFTEHQKLFKPDSWLRLRSALARTWEGGGPYELELEMVRPDGNPAWMWVRGEAISNDQGVIVSLRGVAQDITERQLAAAELFKAYAALEETIEQRTAELSYANVALKMENTERKKAEEELHRRTVELQIKNRHLECLFELSHLIEKHGEQRTQLYYELIPLLQRALNRPVFPHISIVVDAVAVSSIAANEETIQEETFPIYVDGKRRGEIRLARLPQQPSIVLTADEVNLLGAVTERLGRLVIWFDALRVAQERQLHLIQADKLASLGVMVAGVAHEINNPVNNIMLNASLLRDVVADALPILDDHRSRVGDFLAGGLPYSEMRNHLSELMAGILEGSERIKTITGDLRDSVPSNVEMSRELTQLNQVIANSIRMCAHIGKQFREKVVLSLAEDLPLVSGSHRRLEQVVINLIQNAWQSLERPEARMYVTTAVDAQSGMVVVDVRDEGCGMSSEVLARIKDPFFTTRRDKGGTGLGIPVSNGIVEEMGGILKFESVEGKGTLARICMPVP